MKNIFKRASKAFWHRVGTDDRNTVWRIMRNPPEIRQDHIVFCSSDDYTGNPKALFLYMVEHGYNERWHLTWLFEKEENYFEFDIPNVDSFIIYNDEGYRRPEAQKAIMSARYIFYSHNVNWCRSFRPGQTFINLWHGCGYKGRIDTDSRKIHYDYVMATSQKYIKLTREYLKDPDGKVLDLGYPRNEFFLSNRSDAHKVLEEMKAEAGAGKAIIWMPTYRKSRLARMDTDTNQGSTGLPVLYETKDILEIDRWCREKGVLLILKQHMHAGGYETGEEKTTNIKFIDDAYLADRNADLYEMMAVTDSLLTDYSSVAIDYFLLDKPLGYTLDDYEVYEAKRGFSFDNVKEFMPGHHIYTVDDMKKYIRDISEGLDLYKEWRDSVLPEAHTYRDGFSKRILDYFGIK